MSKPFSARTEIVKTAVYKAAMKWYRSLHGPLYTSRKLEEALAVACQKANRGR